MPKKKNASLSKMLTGWVEYLNDDPEVRKRLSKEGICASLGEGERELIGLSIKGSPEEYVIRLKEGTFYLEATKGKTPAVSIRTPREAFLRMASFEDRVVWFLLDDEVDVTLSEGESWHNIVTFLETFVALQELLEQRPEFKVA